MPLHLVLSLFHGLYHVASLASEVSRDRQCNRNRVIIRGPQPGGGAYMADAPTTVPYQSFDANPDHNQHYSSKAKVTALIQISAGTIATVCGIFMIVIAPVTLSFVGVGIWGGAMFFISGVIGIFAASRRQDRLIVAYLVMSIICAVIAGSATLFFTWAIIIGTREYDEISYYGAYVSPMYIASMAVLAVVLSLECIVALIASGLACCGLSRAKVDNNSSTQMTVQPNQPYGFNTNGPVPMALGQTVGPYTNTCIPGNQPFGSTPGAGFYPTVVSASNV